MHVSEKQVSVMNIARFLDHAFSFIPRFLTGGTQWVRPASRATVEKAYEELGQRFQSLEAQLPGVRQYKVTAKQRELRRNLFRLKQEFNLAVHNLGEVQEFSRVASEYTQHVADLGERLRLLRVEFLKYSHRPEQYAQVATVVVQDDLLHDVWGLAR